MRKLTKVFIVSSLFLFVSCQTTQVITEEPELGNYYEQVITLQNSNLKTQQARVIDTQNMFEALKTQIQQTSVFSKVSYEKDQKWILAAAGSKRTGGYSVKLSSVKDSGNKLEYRFTVVEPKEGSPVTMAFTTPAILLQVKDSDKQIKAIIE